MLLVKLLGKIKIRIVHSALNILRLRYWLNQFNLRISFVLWNSILEINFKLSLSLSFWYPFTNYIIKKRKQRLRINKNRKKKEKNNTENENFLLHIVSTTKNMIIIITKPKTSALLIHLNIICFIISSHKKREREAKNKTKHKENLIK